VARVEVDVLPTNGPGILRQSDGPLRYRVCDPWTIKLVLVDLERSITKYYEVVQNLHGQSSGERSRSHGLRLEWTREAVHNLGHNVGPAT
jgi:hypothetical protein